MELEMFETLHHGFVKLVKHQTSRESVVFVLLKVCILHSIIDMSYYVCQFYFYELYLPLYILFFGIYPLDSYNLISMYEWILLFFTAFDCSI